MKQAKKIKAKEPVKLRFRKLENGNESAYMDIYQKGKRNREFLKIYIVPEITNTDKETNRQMIELANAIKAQKIIELKNSENGFATQGIKQKACIYDYIKKLADEKYKTRPSDSSTSRNYKTLISRLKQFSGDRTTFKRDLLL